MGDSDSIQSNVLRSGSGASITDTSNLLYVHPSDHPGSPLISQVFDGKFYSEWRRSVKIALSVKNKLCFIDGTLAKPSSESDLLKNWKRCNDLVISWLLNGLSQEIRSSVIYFELAKEIWDELETRFGVSSGAQLYSIQRELGRISQNSASISTYFTKIKSYWDELASLKQKICCHICGAVQDVSKQDDEQRLIQFLMGLDDTYATARANLLMMRPLPKVSYAYSILAAEEEQRGASANSKLLPKTSSFCVNTRKDNTIAAVVQAGNQKPKDTKVCNYCKKTGHLIEKCFKLHGFPPDFKFTKFKSKIAAAVQGEVAPVTVPGLTSAQYAQILNIPNSSNNQEVSGSAGVVKTDTQFTMAGITSSTFASIGSWLRDSGASNHMCCDMNLFSSTTKLQVPYFVILPNGNKLMVEYEGKVNLSDQITLENVLYVPLFKFNLLSVARFVEQNNYSLLFTKNGCVVQGLSIKKQLEIGKAIKGLYILHLGSLSAQVSGSTAMSTIHKPSNNCLLWHIRLGHLPAYKLKHFTFVNNFDMDSIIACEIYAKARQHRLPFSLSRIDTTHIFQLIHIDVWGPYHIATYNGYKYFLTIVDDFSRATWTFLLSTKGGAFDIVKIFIAMVERQFGQQVKIIRSDNALELGSSFSSSEFLK